jgi:hypothetical protein
MYETHSTTLEECSVHRVKNICVKMGSWMLCVWVISVCKEIYGK